MSTHATLTQHVTDHVTTRQPHEQYNTKEMSTAVPMEESFVELSKLRKSPVRVYPIPAPTEKGLSTRWDKEVIVGFDSEWYPEDKKRRINVILSYQIAVLHGGMMCSRIFYPEPGQRLSIAELMELALGTAMEAGVVSEVPHDVYGVAHWTTADVRSFRDFSLIKTLFDGLRGSFVTLREPLKNRLADTTTGKTRGFLLHLRDSKLLAPNGKQALEGLGELIGFQKVDLPEGTKERMDELLRDDPVLFESYAVRDAEISALYLRHVASMLAPFIPTGERIPVTIGGVAQDALLQIFQKNGTNVPELFGKDVITRKKWSHNKCRTVKEEVRKEMADLNWTLACEAYHGGRNETYQFGVSSEGDWSDYDFASAYPSALASLRTPDWDNMVTTTKLEDFTLDAMGFALAEFRFPKHVRFPALPVRTERGLLFPRAGKSFCTAPEILTAVRLGATLKIKQGVVIPAKVDARPFEFIFKTLISLRNLHEKGSLGNLLHKEVGNSIYGKLAQGLKRHRVFDTREGARHDTPPSKITNAYLAAHTTGIVRAGLAEVLNALPDGTQVMSCTTDGLLSTASATDVANAVTGPVCQMLSKVRSDLTGMPMMSPLDLKRSAQQVLGWRRRGQATLIPRGSELILAKAGLKAPTRDVAEQNAWIIDNFSRREFDTKFSYDHLPGLYELYTTENDMVGYYVERRLNMDYDFCRKPLSLETRLIHGMSHVFFDTEPWDTADQAVRAAQEWASFAKTRQVVMRDVTVMREFLALLSILPRPTAKRAHPLKLAVRQFLRAYRHSCWGLRQSFASRRNKKLADWLVSLGLDVTVRDVENAGRSDVMPEEHWVPRTPETLKFVEEIKTRWPEFREDLLFVQGEPDSRS